MPAVPECWKLGCLEPAHWWHQGGHLVRTCRTHQNEDLPPAPPPPSDGWLIEKVAAADGEITLQDLDTEGRALAREAIRTQRLEVVRGRLRLGPKALPHTATQCTTPAPSPVADPGTDPASQRNTPADDHPPRAEPAGRADPSHEEPAMPEPTGDDPDDTASPADPPTPTRPADPYIRPGSTAERVFRVIRDNPGIDKRRVYQLAECLPHAASVVIRTLQAAGTVIEDTKGRLTVLPEGEDLPPAPTPARLRLERRRDALVLKLLETQAAIAAIDAELAGGAHG